MLDWEQRSRLLGQALGGGLVAQVFRGARVFIGHDADVRVLVWGNRKRAVRVLLAFGIRKLLVDIEGVVELGLGVFH